MVSICLHGPGRTEYENRRRADMPQYQVTTAAGVVFDVSADDMDDAFDAAWSLLENEEDDEPIDDIASVRLIKPESH
jgi:hypothetical protein